MTAAIAPAGRLRVGLVFAPAMSVFFVIKEADGTPRGVTVDLAQALAKQASVPLDMIVLPNSGEVTDGVAAGTLDVGFMPVDDERKRRVDFGPAYTLIESTYLVTAASGINSLAGVDARAVRVIGISNTTTIRAANRSLTRTTASPVPSVDAAMVLLQAGAADAFALSRDSLPPLLPALPGSRIVDGGFQRTGIAIAVPKGRPGALDAATAFMNEAKASGLVRAALDRAGVADADVAP